MNGPPQIEHPVTKPSFDSKNAHPAIGDATYVSDDVLAVIVSALPPKVLISMAREAARAQDVRVLAAMTKQGCFDFVEDDRDLPFDDALFADDEIPIVAAWTNVIAGATPGVLSALGDNDKPRFDASGLTGRCLEVSPEFKAAFAENVVAFIASFSRWRRTITRQGMDAVEQRVDDQSKRYGATLAVLMGGACALDLPHTVSLIINQRQAIGQPVLLPAILGLPNGKPLNFNREPYTLRLCPGVLALEFDVPSVVDVLLSHGLLPVDLAGEVKPYGNLAITRRIEVTRLLAEGHMGTTPLAMAEIVNGYNAAGPHGPNHRSSLATLVGLATGGEDNAVWLDWMVQLGMHKADVRHCASLALAKVDTDFLRRIHADIDWSTDVDHPHLVQQALRLARRFDSNGAHEAFVSEMVDWVTAAGQTDAMLAYRLEGKPGTTSFGRPGQSIAEEVAMNGQAGVMLKLLEAGLNPRTPNPQGFDLLGAMSSMTALQQNSGLTSGVFFAGRERVASVIRSWEANRSAAAAMSEMGLDAEDAEGTKKSCHRPAMGL